MSTGVQVPTIHGILDTMLAHLQNTEPTLNLANAAGLTRHLLEAIALSIHEQQALMLKLNGWRTDDSTISTDGLTQGIKPYGA